MPKKIYIVDLTEEERSYLLDFVKHGESSARKFNRARILLLADEGRSDREIAEALHTGTATVHAFANGLWKATWMVPSTSDHVLVERRNWMRRAKPFWKRWPRASHRLGGSVGRCNSWPTVWWS